MDNQTLHQKYLREGTAGHAVIRRFYSRYADVLVHSTIISIDDVVHDVFMSLSKSDFARVQNPEHYVMRAVKLHCWSLLDKAMRMKAVAGDRLDVTDDEDGKTKSSRGSGLSIPHHQLTELEGVELLTFINLFKAQLDPKEGRLLNLLIDGSERSEIAELLGLKLNTLDTNIRRLRIRLANFLRGLGYSYKVLEKFN